MRNHAYDKEYNDRPEVKARKAKWQREHYSPDYARRYYQENKTACLARCLAYNRTEKAKARRRIHQANRKQHALGLAADLTQAQWEEILEEFGRSCAYCGAQGGLQQDHVVPVSKGGAYTRKNILPACGSCNSSKGNKSLLEWLPGRRI